MIVDCAHYRDGRRQHEGRMDPRDAAAICRHEPGFVWLGMVEPAPEELSSVQDIFGLHELAVEDAQSFHLRPKVEQYEGGITFVVLRTARYVDDREEVEFGELFLYAGRDYLLSVRYGQAAPLANVRQELEEHPERLARGPGAVLQAALLHVVQSYEPVIEGLEHDVREVERDVFSEDRAQPTKRIYLLIREVLDFLVALEPMSASIKKLTSAECMAWVHPDTVPLFRDVDDALSDVVERGRTVHQLLQNALMVSRAEAERQQNEDTRKISAWAAIGIVPTIVAGFFGMNLGGIPLAEHPLGFALVSAMTLAICFALWRLFKHTGWL
jgi:magnesium transporter